MTRLLSHVFSLSMHALTRAQVQMNLPWSEFMESKEKRSIQQFSWTNL